MGDADNVDKLTKLAELREKSLLTQEEFEAQKAKLLAQPDEQLATVTGDKNTASDPHRLLLVAAVLAGLIVPAAFGASPRSIFTLGVAGLCVGVGTRMGNGCTSGHGVCGISRLSLRSIVATVTFMVVAGATVLVVDHVWRMS